MWIVGLIPFDEASRGCEFRVSLTSACGRSRLSGSWGSVDVYRPGVDAVRRGSLPGLAVRPSLRWRAMFGDARDDESAS